MTTKPFHSKYGDLICIDGWLWGLTYSEMGPPDSRQGMGVRCPTCEAEKSADKRDGCEPSEASHK